MKLLEKYSTIIFDLFCTLTVPKVYDHEGNNEYTLLNIDEKTWDHMYDECYYESASGLIQDPGKLVENIALKINPDYSAELIAKVTKTKINIMYECLTHIDPVILQTLKGLKRLSKTIVLISNAEITDKIGWDDSPLKQYFDLAVFSYDVGYLKPDKRIYMHALEKLNVNPKKCLYIGDGRHEELKGAKELGMGTILTTYFLNDLWPERIPDLRTYADYEVNSIQGILDL